MSTPITVTPIDRVGTAEITSLEAAAASDNVLANPGGNTYLWVRNTDTGDHTVSIAFAPGANYDGVTPSARVITVTHGHAGMLLGPFDPVKYNDANGNLVLTFSSITGMMVAGLSQGTR